MATVTSGSPGLGRVRRSDLSHVDVREYRSLVSDGFWHLAIQAAIDEVLFGTARKLPVFIPAGRFPIADTIHAGYGNARFESVTIQGAGWMYRGESQFNGTVLVPNFSDRPAINVQGARGTRIKDIAIHGLLYDYIEAQGLTSTSPLVDDTLAASWADATLAATQDSRYCPYAGVTVDAYSGTRPGTSYPDVAYPASMGVVAQYGKAFSSDVVLDNVYISGFTVGVAVQPCDADGNGDFVTIRDGYLEYLKWGVSVGNSQSRNVGLENCKVSKVYSVITNRTHGKQLGKFGGHINNMSVWHAMNILDLSAYYGQPIQFTNFYGESLWRIGEKIGGAQFEPAVNFAASEFSFALQTPTRGVPATVLASGGPTSMNFDTCIFQTFPSVLMFDQTGISFTGGCHFRHDGDARAASYEQFAHNATAGGAIFPLLQNPNIADLGARYYNLDTGSVVAASARTHHWKNGARAFCIPWYAEFVGATNEDWDKMANPSPYFYGAHSKGSLASVALVDKTLTIEFSSRADALFDLKGPLPGDVIWDDDSKSVFFVRSRTALVVIAELQNNYKSDGAGGFDTITAFSTTVGNLYYRSSRLYTPKYYLRGDTAASTSITNVGRDDGYAAWYESDITVNDRFAIRDTQNGWVSATNSKVSARDHTAGTITLSGAASVVQAKRRLDFFVRLPPANV